MRRITTATLVALGAILGLGSCSTLSEDQCRTGDWSSIGYADGRSGYASSRIEDHAKACAKYSISPDFRAYSRAREDGLKLYCTPANGFRVGRQGESYADVCPADREQGFLAGYSDGGYIHAADSRLSQAQSDRSSADSRARDLESQMRTEENKVGDTNLPKEERDAARERLKRLRDDRERTYDDGRRAERREYEARREIDMLRARYMPIYGAW